MGRFGPFLVPAIGLGLWLIHLGQTFSSRGAGWGRSAWLLGLPALCGGIVVYWFQFAPTRADSHIWATTSSDDFWMGNLFFGLFEWFALVLLEPFLVLAAWGLRWLQAIPMENAAARSSGE